MKRQLSGTNEGWWHVAAGSACECRTHGEHWHAEGSSALATKCQGPDCEFDKSKETTGCGGYHCSCGARFARLHSFYKHAINPKAHAKQMALSRRDGLRGGLPSSDGGERASRDVDGKMSRVVFRDDPARLADPRRTGKRRAEAEEFVRQAAAAGDEHAAPFVAEVLTARQQEVVAQLRAAVPAKMVDGSEPLVLELPEGVASPTHMRGVAVTAIKPRAALAEHASSSACAGIPRFRYCSPMQAVCGAEGPQWFRREAWRCQVHGCGKTLVVRDSDIEAAFPAAVVVRAQDAAGTAQGHTWVTIEFALLTWNHFATRPSLAHLGEWWIEQWGIAAVKAHGTRFLDFWEFAAVPTYKVFGALVAAFEARLIDAHVAAVERLAVELDFAEVSMDGERKMASLVQRHQKGPGGTKQTTRPFKTTMGIMGGRGLLLKVPALYKEEDGRAYETEIAHCCDKSREIVDENPCAECARPEYVSLDAINTFGPTVKRAFMRHGHGVKACADTLHKSFNFDEALAKTRPDARSASSDHKEIFAGWHAPEMPPSVRAQIEAPREGEFKPGACRALTAAVRGGQAGLQNIDAADCAEAKVALELPDILRHPGWQAAFQATPHAPRVRAMARWFGANMDPRTSLWSWDADGVAFKEEFARFVAWYSVPRRVVSRPESREVHPADGARITSTAGVLESPSADMARHLRNVVSWRNVEGYALWREAVLTRRARGRALPSGSTALEAVWAEIRGACFPRGITKLTEAHFQTLMKIAFIRHNFRRMHARGMPQVTRNRTSSALVLVSAQMLLELLGKHGGWVGLCRLWQSASAAVLAQESQLATQLVRSVGVWGRGGGGIDSISPTRSGKGAQQGSAATGFCGARCSSSDWHAERRDTPE